MRTDSATTERMPPGPKSRASVAMTWTKRMTRSRISAPSKNGYPPGIVRHQQFAIDRIPVRQFPSSEEGHIPLENRGKSHHRFMPTDSRD
jgi:hypothetical protein